MTIQMQIPSAKVTTKWTILAEVEIEIPSKQIIFKL